MSRTVSDGFRSAVFAQETGEVFCALVTITHPDFSPGEIIRLASDATVWPAGGAPYIVSRTNTYYLCPFQLSLPIDSDEQPPQARITVDNIDRTISTALRSVNTPPTVSLEVVKSSTPDVVEAAWYDFTMRNINYSSLEIEGILTFENFLQEPYPAHHFTPSQFPEMF